MLLSATHNAAPAFLNVTQAKPDQVKLQLASEGVELEEYGGDVMVRRSDST